MSGSRADIARAEANARAARTRVLSTVERLKDRLNPAVRAKELVGGAREKGEVFADDAVEFAYERSNLIMGIAGAVVLLLVRKSLLGTLKGAFRRRPKWDSRPRWDVHNN